ncbi:uncharacterized peptidase C1-like protein F26E4.3 [Metopolophium dirhodum]|uniref:uncharacterized peptidase C1-like protein F26E4.3 n=1 Tax=Metopolophium dirhodum TaxID=44670 RepID=UPI00298F9209|nr:uncharacterized peptidase C1-like protein F26E4.3 [Metopolophium dirhodum]XP_060868556.1 uncharacterized peptidase C1-like protein F26E4.3 [Metopolophium dirhodum]XP_060868557.1 uncharacterized peptidase C1-like protein F26E4.3 [Metopolophium dirhodum]
MWTRWTFLFEYNMKAGHQNCSRMTTVAVAAMMTLACALKIVAADEGIANDLAGDYCAKVGCCSERQEDCYALISNTRCYCDDFCYHNHTVSNDCCPDFMSVCKGVTTPDPPIIDKCFYDDLAGDYCAKVGCCAGRNDSVCSAPILGTRCYCDDVCYLNRTGSEDCCPDFMSVCKGAVPTMPDPTKNEKCTEKPNYCNHGEIMSINCNACQCQKIGENTTLICNHDECLIDPSLLNTIRTQSRQFGWSAKNYSEFWGVTYDNGLKLRLGTLESPEKILQIVPLKAVFHRDYLKSSFDLRKVFGNKITDPIDQGWCGASWAISTAQVTTDRFVIMTKGLMRDALSPKHLLSCNNDQQRGCQGGHLTSAWNWIMTFGLVTEECYPWDGQATGCAVSNQRSNNNLIVSCPRSAKISPLRRVGLMYRVATEEGIMYEIMNWGSVQAMMKVSKEFFMYESGVYRCSKLALGSKTGYHTVRIVGWGEEQQNGKTVKYWIVSNSWGLWWGESGYFRILKGTNECQIEDFVVAAMADISNFCNISDQSFRENASYTLNGTKIDIS